jgi:hypothetical protein
MSAQKHVARAAIFLLLLLSPCGGPVVGVFIGSFCQSDPTVEPDGPFALGLSYCGINRPIEHFYQKAEMLTVLPMAFAGPIIGGLVTFAWWGLGVAVAVGLIWHLWRALACVTIERL